MNTKELIELSNSAWFDPKTEIIFIPIFATNGQLVSEVIFEKIDGDWISHLTDDEMVDIVKEASKNKKEYIPKETEQKEDHAYKIALQINGKYIGDLTIWSTWSEKYISDYAKCCAIDELRKPDVMFEKFGLGNVSEESQIVRTIYVPEKLINVIVQFAIFINKKGN